MDKKIKILLIEDNCDIINWVTEITNRYNINLEIASNTADYLKLTKKYRFKIILCDISLDYKDEGFDIAKLHKKRRLKAKIVAFTSGNYSKELIKNSGFDFYLDKSSSDLIQFFKQQIAV